MRMASGMDGDPLHIDPAERVWAGIVERLYDDPVTRFQEANSIKIAMQDVINDFRTWTAAMRERVAWEGEGTAIFVYGERYESAREATPGLHTSTTEGWDQGRVEEERRSGYGQLEEQGSSAPPSWIEQWRTRWNVHGDQRSAVVRPSSRATEPEQEQGYGQGYGR